MDVGEYATDGTEKADVEAKCDDTVDASKPVWLALKWEARSPL